MLYQKENDSGICERKVGRQFLKKLSELVSVNSCVKEDARELLGFMSSIPSNERGTKLVRARINAAAEILK